MTVWSSLRPLLLRSNVKSAFNASSGKCYMSGQHRILRLQPSRWQWQKFKDYVHFYIMIGVIPLTALVTYVNVFIGPATLSEIPEGYVPKHWEYYRHPITRFIARYVIASPQQQYEKYLHHLFEEGEKVKLRQLEKEIKAKMAQRKDYQAYYYQPVLAKYHRVTRESADYVKEIMGD